jgi:glycosyltransferase involved in cell wall biosynthesis
MLVDRLAELSVPTHFLALTRPWQFLTGVRRLARLLRQQRADVVQTFLFHANVVGAWAAKRAHITRLVTGVRVADPRPWRSAMERWATSHADKIVCVSRGVAELCRDRGFAADKLLVIPNGIDVALWLVAPADLGQFGVPPGRRVFLFVGRLDDQKGLIPFFHQLPRLLEELPQHDFLLVGDGPLYARLVDLARQLEVGQRIHFAGWQAAIPPLMAAADLLVLPSRWEGMPNVVLEAMAAARPVVAASAEGVSELLGPAAAEQQVGIGQWSELASRVAHFAKHPDLAARIGSQNHARAQEFSVELMVGNYADLYGSLFAH